ncbi:Initiator Replication protein [Catalinimonas alkaloidigena]|uniref:Initiator Replication protein n=1 Tax=Catalinimonas alkaloidigena TaxID=1075417 RepID=A0A1G9TIM0_9BACT|nr:replication initiation protein [Catalinimonas alkaloidigena]SDM47500.1 Initiator Replication protein [Catalinimonas alkaloidigena]
MAKNSSPPASATSRERVWQSNKLVNARFTFERLEQRIFLKTIATIKQDDEEFREVEIDVRDVLEYSLGGVDYQTIRDACSRLLGKKFEIEDIVTSNNGGTKRRYRGYVIYTTMEYVDGSGKIRAHLSPQIMPFLLQLRGEFTQGGLDELLSLNSHYSYRIYWLLKQHVGLGGVREIEIEELKRMFKLENQYNRFVDFRKRVIDQAQRELAHTSMAFDYELITHKRRAVAIRFTIKKQHDQLELFPAAAHEEGQLFWHPDNPVFDVQYGQRFEPTDRFPTEDVLLAARMLVTNGVDAQGCERWYRSMRAGELTTKQVIAVVHEVKKSQALPASGRPSASQLKKRGGLIHKMLCDLSTSEAAE